MTGIQLERTPNNYIIRVMKRGKCIDWFTYQTANEMVCWFNCLPCMKYGKKIETYGRKLFWKEIVHKVFDWKAEDIYMKEAQKCYHELQGRQ